MSDSTSQTYFSADFGEHGGRFGWASHEEITQWVRKLQNDWNWISKQRNNSSQAVWQAINQPLNNVTQALNQAITHRNQGQEQHAISQLSSAKSELENLIRPYPWLLPNQSRRLFVEGYRDTGQPIEAALIVAHWMQQDFNNNAPIRQLINAILAWELHERGIKDRMKTENAALKRLAGDMQSALTQLQESELAQSGRFDELHGQIFDQTTTQQNTFDTSQVQRDTQWQEKLSGMQAELQNLKDTYDKHMALAAPVEYWDKKREKHGRWTVVSFVATVVCMVALGWTLHNELQDIGKVVEEKRTAAIASSTKISTPVPAASSNSSRNVEFAASKDPIPQVVQQMTLLESAATWKIGSLVLLVTLSFWFIRLLVRIFLSNLHLENDAAERVTMAKTYLAMIRDDALPKGENISTVLAALFRPTGDGIVKDEGLPPTAMEWLTKLGGR